nr:MAG TPA: hypothetical protein [Caudoviricetes sp.]DAP25125.1 MAG TPA: hypothetical protein [Caudoviricetes sp.]
MKLNPIKHNKFVNKEHFDKDLILDFLLAF